ncbi:MAG: hemerythrin domain-containing protein [Casimicrobium sp.]
MIRYPVGKSEAPVDAITFLNSDHVAVEGLFAQFKALADVSNPAHETKRTLARKICALLNVHTQVEEELFYPAVRESLGLDASALMEGASVEHALCSKLISQIESMEPLDHRYEARVIVLGDYIERHIKEEERAIFSKMRKANFDSVGLAHELAIRKHELLSDYSRRKNSHSTNAFA